MKTYKPFIILAVLLGLLWFAPAVLAQGATPPPITDDDVNRIAKQLFCPVCENVPLDVCPTQACKQWRATIREKLEAGWSEQQIKDYFAEQYGERVLAQPSTRGLNLFIWIIPPLALGVGLFVWWRFLRGMLSTRSAPAVETPATSANDDKYAALLEQELEKRR